VPSSLGAAVTLEQLELDPHPVLARLREREPVSWIPVLNGWLVTGYELAAAVMRDASTFTVDDPRFSTALLIGSSMLSLDGDEHERHRAPFVGPFRLVEVRRRFENEIEAHATRLLDALAPAGSAELRRNFCGPLAAAVLGNALGLGRDAADELLAAYSAIVGAVTEITAGVGRGAGGIAAFDRLRKPLRAAVRDDAHESLLAAVVGAAASTVTEDEVIANAGILLFGGIETTEGMIANAVLQLLEHRDQLAQARADPSFLDAAIDESLRLEPAASVVDRYATRSVELAGAQIRVGDLVRVSIAGANRDPAAFADPDRFDPGRFDPGRPERQPRRHLAFAHGPHVCLGVHLARLEARVAVRELLRRLPQLRLDPARPALVRGLVFRKPVTLNVLWSR
jgi:cytochrome P450